MQRTDYIGSSDAKHILSGDWDRVYREKKGFAEPPDLSDVFPVQFGAFCEDFHLTWTLRRLNEAMGLDWKHSKFQTDGEQHFATYVPDAAEFRPVLGSHPDALVRSSTGHIYPCEVKLTGRFRTAEEAAEHYMPQLQHHMICWDSDRLLFSVVIGTSEPERIWIGASPEWQAHYIDKCNDFWRHIVTDSAPAPLMVNVENAPLVPTKIKDSVPFDGLKKRCLDGDNQAPALIEQFIETKDAVKRHEEAKTGLKALMADDEGEIYNNRISLKRDKRGAIRIKIKEDAA